MSGLPGFLTQILITLGFVLPAFLGGMFARRKSSADVEVTLSAEARAWATSFAEGARTATEAARNAMEQAKDAADRAASAEARVQRCQDRVDALERHITRLETIMRENGVTPPVPPWTSRES